MTKGFGTFDIRKARGRIWNVLSQIFLLMETYWYSPLVRPKRPGKIKIWRTLRLHKICHISFFIDSVTIWIPSIRLDKPRQTLFSCLSVYLWWFSLLFYQYFNKNNRLKIEGPNVVVFVINKTLAVTSHKMETVKSNTPERIDTLFYNL